VNECKKGQKKWQGVSKGSPCPICGKADAKCAVATNGSAAICHVIPNGPKLPTGGWRHALRKVTIDELPLEKQYRKGDGFKRTRPPQGPFQPEHFLRLPTGRKQYAFCAMLAEKLGVAARALESLDVRWDEAHQAAAIPMKAPDACHYTGVNYRYVKTGEKFNAEGSVDGLFIPMDLDTYDRSLVVCEGASDTAAAMTLGIKCAVGRSSCRSGEALVCELCRIRRIRRVVIFADRDTPTEDTPEGVGLAGAKALATAIQAMTTDDGEAIAVALRQPSPGFKDLRAECMAGASVNFKPSSSRSSLPTMVAVASATRNNFLLSDQASVTSVYRPEATTGRRDMFRLV